MCLISHTGLEFLYVINSRYKYRLVLPSHANTRETRVYGYSECRYLEEMCTYFLLPYPEIFCSIIRNMTFRISSYEMKYLIIEIDLTKLVRLKYIMKIWSLCQKFLHTYIILNFRALCIVQCVRAKVRSYGAEINTYFSLVHLVHLEDFKIS